MNKDRMKSLDNFEVYQKAILLLGLVTELLEGMPDGNTAIKDQLKRCSLSVVLNTAEGAGKSTGRDKSKYFAIARGSALETYAIFDACVAMKLCDRSRLEVEKQIAREIVSMLTPLTKFRA